MDLELERTELLRYIEGMPEAPASPSNNFVDINSLKSRLMVARTKQAIDDIRRELYLDEVQRYHYDAIHNVKDRSIESRMSDIETRFESVINYVTKYLEVRTGPTGPAGLHGESGPQGLTGKTGDIGPTGSRGVEGEQGPTGPMGLDGLTGLTGESGIQGLTGKTGGIGPAGLEGKPGPQSHRGKQGTPGIQGTPGCSGRAGR